MIPAPAVVRCNRCAVKDWQAEGLTATQIRSYIAYLVGDMRHGGPDRQEDIEDLQKRLAEIQKEKGEL